MTSFLQLTYHILSKYFVTGDCSFLTSRRRVGGKFAGMEGSEHACSQRKAPAAWTTRVIQNFVVSQNVIELQRNKNNFLLSAELCVSVSLLGVTLGHDFPISMYFWLRGFISIKTLLRIIDISELVRFSSIGFERNRILSQFFFWFDFVRIHDRTDRAISFDQVWLPNSSIIDVGPSYPHVLNCIVNFTYAKANHQASKTYNDHLNFLYFCSERVEKIATNRSVLLETICAIWNSLSCHQGDRT